MKSNTERPSAADPVPDAIQTLPDPTQKWKFISNLHPLSIVFVIIVLFSILTYVIPGGAYDRYEVTIGALGGETREVLDPESFHNIPSNPQGFLQLWTAFLTAQWKRRTSAS